MRPNPDEAVDGWHPGPPSPAIWTDFVRQKEEDMKPLKKLHNIHEKIAADVPQIARGKVWCQKCGREQAVDGAECLRSGWPLCHGATMTIDHPNTWES